MTKKALAKLIAQDTKFTDEGDVLFHLNGGKLHYQKQIDVEQTTKKTIRKIRELVWKQ